MDELLIEFSAYFLKANKGPISIDTRYRANYGQYEDDSELFFTREEIVEQVITRNIHLLGLDG